MAEQGDYRISVVIPAYNAGKYVVRALDSVLSQTVAPCEVIVVDDGSTDDTGAKVAGYGSKVTYIRQENAGASVARNAGIEAATGEWIAFLDADDEWLPENLQVQIDNLRRNSDLVWTTANYLNCVCTTGRRGPHMAPARADELISHADYWQSYFDGFLKNLCGCTITMLVRRDVLFEAGLFLPGLARGNDYDMWWRIAYRYPKIGYITKPLAIYHLDIPGSIIRKHTDSSISRELIARHLALAAEHGKIADFRPCSKLLLRRWIRSMLFEADADGIRAMIRQFPDFLSVPYKAFIWPLTFFPKTTAAGCRTISRIVRLLGLRKKVVRTRKDQPQADTG